MKNEIEVAQEFHREVSLPLLDKVVAKLTEGKEVNPPQVRFNTTSRLVRFDDYGKGFYLEVSIGTDAPYRGKANVRFGIALKKRIENEISLARLDRERIERNNRPFGLLDSYMYHGNPPIFPHLPLGGRRTIEMLEGEVGEIVEFYLKFYEEDGKAERTIPQETYSYDLFKAKEEKELSLAERKAKNNNYRLED